jgi:4-amino-4-deoxy-L-arabinose transferase-like glycosyltransferase
MQLFQSNPTSATLMSRIRGILRSRRATPGGEPPSPSATWAPAAAVGVLAFAYLAHGRGTETYFIDESYYLTQGYYADLLIEGQRDDPAWLSLAAIDHPPLAKYFIGLALRFAGERRLGPVAAAAWQLRYNLKPVPFESLSDQPYVTPARLDAARWPATILGTLGCVAAFGIGVMVRDRRTGAVAACLLAVNPLYRLEARRALPDVPCEALVLAAAAVALWGWNRALAGRLGPWRGLGVALGGGVLAGLAALAKLTGCIIFLLLVASAALALVLPRIPPRRKAVVAAGALTFTLVGAGTLLALNPTLTAQPPAAALASPRVTAVPRDESEQVPDLPGSDPEALVRQGPAGRFLTMLAYRKSFSAMQQEFYPIYALRTITDKLEVVLVQGFGRFSPFGPAYSHIPARFDWPQDRWGLIWLPWVALGAGWAVERGRRQVREGRPPTAWFLLLHAAIAWVCVTLYIPLAWDRYLLPIQPATALLAAGAAVSCFDHIVGAKARWSSSC